MGIGRDTHHVQLVFSQDLCSSVVARSFREGLCAIWALQGCQERALPHGTQIMLPKWLGAAFDERPFILPACSQATHESNTWLDGTPSDTSLDMRTVVSIVHSAVLAVSWPHDVNEASQHDGVGDINA